MSDPSVNGRVFSELPQDGVVTFSFYDAVLDLRIHMGSIRLSNRWTSSTLMRWKHLTGLGNYPQLAEISAYVPRSGDLPPVYTMSTSFRTDLVEFGDILHRRSPPEVVHGRADYLCIEVSDENVMKRIQKLVHSEKRHLTAYPHTDFVVDTAWTCPCGMYNGGYDKTCRRCDQMASFAFRVAWTSYLRGETRQENWDAHCPKCVIPIPTYDKVAAAAVEKEKEEEEVVVKEDDEKEEDKTETRSRREKGERKTKKTRTMRIPRYIQRKDKIIYWSCSACTAINHVEGALAVCKYCGEESNLNGYSFFKAK